jgi:hypothetical protein
MIDQNINEILENKKALLVLSDVDACLSHDKQAFKAFLITFLNRNPKIKILLTSTAKIGELGNLTEKAIKL